MMRYIDRNHTRQSGHTERLAESTALLTDFGEAFRAPVPFRDENNWGTFRLSPGILPEQDPRQRWLARAE